MAALKPKSINDFTKIKGVGERKLKEFCPLFLEVIHQYCGYPDIPNSPASLPFAEEEPTHSSKFDAKKRAFQLFKEGTSLEVVAAETNRSASTVRDYCCEYLREYAIDHPRPWVDEDTFRQVSQVFAELGTSRLKPVYEALDSAVDYSALAICRVAFENTSQTATFA